MHHNILWSQNTAKCCKNQHKIYMKSKFKRCGKKSVARSMYPCGEINVSEKSVAKSCVAKLSVAKSTYTWKYI